MLRPSKNKQIPQTTKQEQKVWETIIGMRSRRYVIGTLNDSVTGEGSIENLLKFE